MSTTIQLHRLEGFYWVARTNGYARAARAFPYPITQPAVHQQVKKLEGELEVTLFERVGKDRMILTPAGRRLNDFVAPFFEALPGVLRSIRQADYTGELHIAAACMFLRTLLPSWIKRLHKSFPEIEVHMTEANTPDVEALRRGELDVIVDHIPEIPDDLATLQVASMKPFLVLPRSHPMASRKRIAPQLLESETFIAYNADLLAHELQLAALRLHDLRPARILTASTAESILGFVEAGLGYSMLPSLEPNGPRGRNLAVLPLASPKTEFPVYVAWRKDTPENLLLDALLETAPG